MCDHINATAKYCTIFVGGKHALIQMLTTMVKNFLITNELALSNTWYQHKKVYKDTWNSNTGKVSKPLIIYFYE